MSRQVSPGSAGEYQADEQVGYFGHQMQTADTLEKTLMPGKIEGRRRRARQRMRWLDGIPNAINTNLHQVSLVT